MMAHLLALATSTPPHRLGTEDAKSLARQAYGGRGVDLDRYMPVFDNAGIESRALAMPMDWYLQPHGWNDRNEIFRRCALDLLAEAAEEALDQAELDPSDVDALVVVSTTGVVTPSLDALLMERMPFRRDVLRTPIFGLGCAGGVSGLARATMLARSMPGKTV
ncbi:MAG: type III polyketide synthase, partial [Pseudomonadota bacterium]